MARAATNGMNMASPAWAWRSWIIRRSVKRVIFLFMNGGLSTIDAFDPKPALEKYDGQPMPGGSIATERRTGELMKSPYRV